MSRGELMVLGAMLLALAGAAGISLVLLVLGHMAGPHARQLGRAVLRGALALLLIAAVVTLAACGGGSDDDDSTSPLALCPATGPCAPQEQAPSAPATTQPVRCDVYPEQCQ